MDQGWYVQVRAKMPDQSQGMWPAIWFLPGIGGHGFNEVDQYEGGMLASPPNQIGSSNFFADQGQQGALYNVGFDVTAAYHVYGIEFKPGVSITAYVDGTQKWQTLASNGVTIAGEPYEIMLELQVAGSWTSGWHTVTNANTPTSTMSVSEVQAYVTARPPPPASAPPRSPPARSTCIGPTTAPTRTASRSTEPRTLAVRPALDCQLCQRRRERHHVQQHRPDGRLCVLVSRAGLSGKHL